MLLPGDATERCYGCKRTYPAAEVSTGQCKGCRRASGERSAMRRIGQLIINQAIAERDETEPEFQHGQ